MPLGSRTEAAAAGAALLLCGAFVVSFALGLRRAGGAEPAAVESNSIYAVPERMIGRVEVLNASGRGGMARHATDRLRSGGFDVVYFGNAGSAWSPDSSVVVARSGSEEVAQSAARRLGIEAVRTQRDSTLFVDATVVLGTDWLREQEAAAAVEPRFRDRLSRWLRPSR
jgi:hypothetical protein